MRMLSSTFMNDLKNPAGILRPIVERVSYDHTLMLAIRDSYINIYYRGGNLLKISEQTTNNYQAYFDTNYNYDDRPLELPVPKISNRNEAQNWVDSFATTKEIMDIYFAGNNKPEREFQQLVARENNFSSISNQSEYFISDIEFTDKDISARFDMLAIRWLASQRKNGSNCKPALIEMKYGDGALKGDSGLIKHLKDTEMLVSNRSHYAELLQTMESQFNQLDELGLLNFKRAKKTTRVKLDSTDKPEVIIILANHNPRSKKLVSILDSPDFRYFVTNSKFQLKFFISSFAGYGLHSKCMVTITKLRELLDL